MSPVRLRRPEDLKEACRLCGAPLELSPENPRRVCAACGEVNLPNDGAPIVTEPVRGQARVPGHPQARAAPLRTKQELRVAAIGAAAPLLAAIYGVVANLTPRSHGALSSFDAGFSAAFALIPLLFLSLLGLVLVLVGPKSPGPVGLVFWIAGLIAGGSVGGMVVLAWVYTH